MFNFLKKKEIKKMTDGQALAMYIINNRAEAKRSFEVIMKNIILAKNHNDNAIKAMAEDRIFEHDLTLRNNSYRIINIEISCLNIAVEKATGVNMGLSFYFEDNNDIVWLLKRFLVRVKEAEKMSSELDEFLDVYLSAM